MDSENWRRDVAGRFVQAGRAKGSQVAHRLYGPDVAPDAFEYALRKVEDDGSTVEGIEVILAWFRSEADVEWLDQFWQTEQGGRFLDLTAELMVRAMHNLLYPDAPLPPPRQQ